MSGLPPRERLLEIYETTNRIAVVGMSASPDKDAHSVPTYLQEQGYEIVPVTPRAGTILGAATIPSLSDLTGPVDVVNVFRPPEEGPGIATAAAATGASVLWMQPGTESEEAVAIAENAGLTVIAGHCMRATHQLLGLGS